MKTYMKPCMEVLNLDVENMMAVSGPGLSDNNAVVKDGKVEMEGKERDAWSDDGGLW